jgi:P4 family phage/plasmid primase-like protien
MEEMNAYPSHWINFKNGMLDVREKRMKKHNPKYLALNQIPHNYNPDAVPEQPENTTIMKFLSTSIPDREDQMMLFEYVGYCMTRDTGFQKFLMITGKGGTGKSQIISLIQHIVGEENCSPLSIQDLGQRFYPSELYGKLLNACPDIKGGTLDDVSNLKKATGEDILMYERKNKNPSSFRSYAKLLFSANEIPLNLDEKSNAFYRRLLILGMNREINDEEKDRELLLKLKRETEYIIYLACVSLSKLYSEGKFTESDNSKKFVQELYRAADSVKAFLDEMMVPDPGSRIGRTELYKLYQEYCVEYGRKGHGRNQFFKSVEEKGYIIIKIKGVRYFNGLKQREEEFETDDDEENPFSDES